MSSTTKNTIENFELTEQQLRLVKKAAKENGIENFETVTNAGSIKGDNFVAQILRVNVTDQNSNKQIFLILKVTRVDQLFPSSTFFVREALMYNDVLPQLLKFQSDANISNPFRGVAKCYGSYLGDNEEAILLEDVMTKGFRMWNKRYPMEDDHISLVMSEYAKLHAISIAIMKHDPKKYEEWKKQLKDVFDTGDDQIFKNMIVRAKANGMDALKDENLKKKLDETWDSSIAAVKTATEEPLVVVTHGDSWCNNMMFNYKNSTVQEVCFIDWQVSKMGTPMWDLIYFFHVCASKQVLNNYKKYLQLYHKTLSENLKEFGCDADEIFTYETLLDKWDKYASMGLFCVLMLGKVMMADTDDIPDNLTTQIGEDFKKSFADVIIFDEAKQAAYDQRITDIVQYMLDNGFLKKFRFPDVPAE